MQTIHELRKQGNKLRITHYRWVKRWMNLDGETAPKFERVTKEQKKAKIFRDILPLGGETVIDLTDKVGRSWCAKASCSDKDPFNRRVGIQIALGRIAKQMEIA